MTVTLAKKSFSFKFEIAFSNFGGEDFIFDAISSIVKYVPGISDSDKTFSKNFFTIFICF